MGRVGVRVRLGVRVRVRVGVSGGDRGMGRDRACCCRDLSRAVSSCRSLGPEVVKHRRKSPSSRREGEGGRSAASIDSSSPAARAPRSSVPSRCAGSLRRGTWQLARVWQAEAEVRREVRGEMVRGATGRATGRGERGCGRAHIGISSDESADSSSSLSRTSTCAWCLAPSSVCRRSSAISVICCRLRSATSASPVRFSDMPRFT